MTPSVFDPQLESIAVARTSLSRLDGEDGDLVVGGYPIEDLAANASYEEACYLLLHDRLPTADELATFRAALADRRGLDPAVGDLLAAAAADDAHPMDALRMGMAAATLGHAADTRMASIQRVVAVLPTVVATYWRHREGYAPVAPDPSLDHAENYLAMLTGEQPDEGAVDALETFLVTAVEHGLNTSTFAARTAVSTGSDVAAGVTAAVCTLKGPGHGGAFDRVATLLRRVDDASDPDAVLREALDEWGSLPGFGHPVYRTRDPRSPILAAAAKTCHDGGPAPLAATARELESLVEDLADERTPARPLVPTLDLDAVPLLDGIGIPTPLFTPTFAVARAGGWAAHCREQLAEDHLIRPGSRYVGRSASDWEPLERRWAVGEEGLDGAALSDLSETLAVLAEPSRLEILLALAEADAPMAYTTLREATAFQDKGRFNYHLRQLRDTFVDDGDAGYALTPTGRAVVETVVTEERLFGAN